MVNINDIAKLANVSPMTVSRVINNSVLVKEETRKKVQKIIDELNYIPNKLAQNMVKQKGTSVLGLIIPDISNQFYTSVARGVEDIARKSNFTLILCNHDDDESKEYDYVCTLMSSRVDGFLVIPSGDRGKKSFRLLTQSNFPVVMIDRQPKGFSFDYVGGDSINSASKLIAHFAQLGHSRIGFINGPKHISTARDRLTGYKQGLKSVNLPFESELVFEGNSFAAEIANLALDKFLKLPDPPTAILAANNFIALGFIRAARNLKLHVPNHFSLACFDRFENMDLISPTLTMAVQPAYNFGSIATQLLLERLEGKNVEKNRKIILSSEFIVGNSSRNIQKTKDKIT